MVGEDGDAGHDFIVRNRFMWPVASMLNSADGSSKLTVKSAGNLFFESAKRATDLPQLKKFLFPL